MTAQEVAKSIMKITGTTQSKIAEMTGLAGQSSVATFFRSQNMRIDTFMMILNSCGYELVARSEDESMPEFVIGKELRRKAEHAGESEPADNDMQDMIRRIVAEELRKAKGRK